MIVYGGDCHDSCMHICFLFHTARWLHSSDIPLISRTQIGCSKIISIISRPGSVFFVAGSAVLVTGSDF
ncbi:hypothetical protein V6Z11_D13G000300 [Gossypium hirsutum]